MVHRENIETRCKGRKVRQGQKQKPMTRAGIYRQDRQAIGEGGVGAGVMGMMLVVEGGVVVPVSVSIVVVTEVGIEAGLEVEVKVEVVVAI